MTSSKNGVGAFTLKTDRVEIKAYKRRWIIMLMFVWYSCISSIQWIEYSSITNLAMKYYDVSSQAVDWTSIIYMAIYPLLVVPASFLMDKMGLRATVLIGCIGTLVGSAIKLFSIGRDLFYVVLIGQTTCAVFQLFIACLPTKLAAVWFKSNEVSSACSLGVFGSQLGSAIGFFLPSYIVKDSDNPELIGASLRVLCYVITIAMIPISGIVIFFFPTRPPLPPSNTQLDLMKLNQKFSSAIFFNTIKQLFCHTPFMIHMVAFGINVSVYCTVCTMLNQYVLHYFPGAQEDAGMMGFIMIVAGMVGTIIFGIVLDKTHRFKETTFFVYFMSIISVVLLTYSLSCQSKLLVYISCGVFGFFLTAYTPVGFELCLELTYPLEQGLTTGILTAFSQIFSVILVTTLGFFISYLEPFGCLAIQAVILVVGTIVTAFIPNQLKRQEAFRKCNKLVYFTPVPLQEKL